LGLGAAIFFAGAGRLAAQSALERAGFDRGDPAAPLLVVEFADFGCPACAEFARETWAAIDSEFVQGGRVRWKFVPFVLGPFRHAEAAARAALCAAEQGAFWPMADRLYADQRVWSVPRNPKAAFQALARGLGLDSARFEHCSGDERVARQVQDLTRLARRQKVNATPTFLVGERRIRGALPLALFRQVLLEAEAARSAAPRP
jgi:protein-disulfide isomerase